MSDLWIEERMSDYLTIRYHLDKTLFSGKSTFQQVDVVETAGFGRMLLIDKCVMITERDEFVYHDMISHVPLYVHPEPRRVLVIGGGDGGTLREVLRHTTVEKCTVVEIDRSVIDVCKQYIPQTSKSFSNPRTDLHIANGATFVATTQEIFDVVISDSTYPSGPATSLFGKQFFSHVHRILTENGIFVAQAESPFYDPEVQKLILQRLNDSFERVHMYNYSNLTYPGGIYSLAYASKNLCPIKDLDSARVEQEGLKFEYYNPDLHRAAFVLPSFQKRNLSGLLDPFDKSYEFSQISD